MGTQSSILTDRLTTFIQAQAMFTVATATADSRISCSPKGMDCLQVLAPDRLIWGNLTGSGNETAAHLRHDGRITMMWCSVATEPLILRVYGRARAIHAHEEGWDELLAQLPPLPDCRQIIDVVIDSVQTSCGFGVPLMEVIGERPKLREWCEKKGPDGLRIYQQNKNMVSIDGLPTGVLPEQ